MQNFRLGFIADTCSLQLPRKSRASSWQTKIDKLDGIINWCHLRISRKFRVSISRGHSPMSGLFVFHPGRTLVTVNDFIHDFDDTKFILPAKPKADEQINRKWAVLHLITVAKSFRGFFAMGSVMRWPDRLQTHSFFLMVQYNDDCCSGGPPASGGVP
ncbi:hypothetical protein Ddc_02186 [Ditylenchus destructor]|nr:hypothetical protein Ddc_02186 [Ditylenchus destructor]